MLSDIEKGKAENEGFSNILQLSNIVFIYYKLEKISTGNISLSGLTGF